MNIPVWTTLGELRKLELFVLIIYRSDQATELIQQGNLLAEDLKKWVPLFDYVSELLAESSKEPSALFNPAGFPFESKIAYPEDPDLKDGDTDYLEFEYAFSCDKMSPSFALHDVERFRCFGFFPGRLRHGTVKGMFAIAGPDNLWLDYSDVHCGLTNVDKSENPNECNVSLCWDTSARSKRSDTLELRGRVKVISIRPIKCGQALVRYKHR